MKIYEKTPLDIVQIGNSKRFTSNDIEIRWNVIAPGQGRNFGQWRKVKQHVEDLIPMIASMNEDDLIKIIEAARDGIIPSLFSGIATSFYEVLQNGEAVTVLHIGQGEKLEVFDYKDGIENVRVPIKSINKFSGINFNEILAKMPQISLPTFKGESLKVSTAN